MAKEMVAELFRTSRLLKNDIFLCHCEAILSEVEGLPKQSFNEKRLSRISDSALRDSKMRNFVAQKNGLLAMTNDFDCTNSCERNYDKENFNNLLVSCTKNTFNNSD
jgi:hypothetical protein